MAVDVLNKDPVADIPLARRAGLDPEAVRETIERLVGERDSAVEQGRQAHLELSRQREALDRAECDLEAARQEVALLRERESAVGEALVVANNVAAGIRDEATREAERIVSEARVEAESLLAEAQAKADQRLREAALEATTMAEATRAHIDRLRGEEQAVARTAQDIAVTLRDMAAALERAIEGAVDAEPEVTAFGDTDVDERPAGDAAAVAPAVAPDTEYQA
jgi:dsDNA-specific endonuclease/ATPase MutS2